MCLYEVQAFATLPWQLKYSCGECYASLCHLVTQSSAANVLTLMRISRDVYSDVAKDLGRLRSYLPDFAFSHSTG